jgi:hypothetical protein
MEKPRMPVHPARRSLASVLPALLLAGTVACAPSGERSEGDTTIAPPAAAAPAAMADTVAPATIARAQLASLAWIVGDWWGEGAAGTVQAPFFERYRFADDSTLLVESFADSAFARPTETTRWELRGGRLGNPGDGARWVAVSLDSAGVRFAPVARARNSFTWRRAEGTAATAARPAEWVAVIESADAAGAPQRRTYRMARVR